MHRKNLLRQLEDYLSSMLITPNEIATLARLIDFITTNEQCFERSNTGHITSSVWITNAEHTHALLTHHKKFDMWVQLGGHNDGDSDCKATALKEAEEESGIQGFIFLHEGIFDIDIHAIPGPCAYHYDIRYLLQAPANAKYLVSDESHDLSWVPFDDIKNYSSEQSILRLNEKARQFLEI